MWNLIKNDIAYTYRSFLASVIIAVITVLACLGYAYVPGRTTEALLSFIVGLPLLLAIPVELPGYFLSLSLMKEDRLRSHLALPITPFQYFLARSVSSVVISLPGLLFLFAYPAIVHLLGGSLSMVSLLALTVPWIIISVITPLLWVFWQNRLKALAVPLGFVTLIGVVNGPQFLRNHLHLETNQEYLAWLAGSHALLIMLAILLLIVGVRLIEFVSRKDHTALQPIRAWDYK